MYVVVLIFALLFIIPIPLVYSESEGNLLVISSNGNFDVGAWFYYHVERELNKTTLKLYINISIYDINKSHVFILLDVNGELFNQSLNVSHGLLPFWINITHLLKYLYNQNGTIKDGVEYTNYVLFYNESYIHLIRKSRFLFDNSTHTIEIRAWLGIYGLITKWVSVATVEKSGVGVLWTEREVEERELSVWQSAKHTAVTPEPEESPEPETEGEIGLGAIAVVFSIIAVGSILIVVALLLTKENKLNKRIANLFKFNLFN